LNHYANENERASRVIESGVMKDGEVPAGTVPSSPGTLDEIQKKVIRAQLARVLQSPPFHATRRSQAFLTFIVEKTLEGRFDLLKERCIGAEVFGRVPDYDTNNDAVVRISANDLRKRLAQYEIIASASDEVRILLPPGSYSAEFHWLSTSPTDTSLPQPEIDAPAATASSTVSPRRALRKWPVLAALGVLLPVLVWAGFRIMRPKSALEQFWLPVLQSPNPATISIGQSTVYLLSERIHSKYDPQLGGTEVEAGPHVVNFGSDSIPGLDIIPVTDIYTATGDAIALGRMMEMFARFGKPVKIRSSKETSFSDLRDAPTILLGFNNRWNRDIARELRFSFERRNDTKVMTDHTPPGRIWTAAIDPAGHTSVDYGLISRVFNAGTGQLIIQAGGLASTGTRAAGEFLTRSDAWKGFLDSVPPDWVSKNLQIVIRVKVIGNTPTEPEIVAVHCW
jgi:hypothetical protein